MIGSLGIWETVKPIPYGFLPAVIKCQHIICEQEEKQWKTKKEQKDILPGDSDFLFIKGEINGTIVHILITLAVMALC